MHGLLHEALKEMVLSMHDESNWTNCIKKVKPELQDGSSLLKGLHPDKLSYEVMDELSDILNMPKEVLLKCMGQYFFKHLMSKGYDTMMNILAPDIVSFLQNVNSLHHLVNIIYPGMQYPYIRITEDGAGQLRLHYISSREDLQPFLEGIVQEVAKTLFNKTVELTVLSKKTKHEGRHSNYTIFKMDIKGHPAIKGGLNQGALQTLAPLSPPGVKPPPSSKKTHGKNMLKSISMNTLSITPAPSPDTLPNHSDICKSDFEMAFPYHLLMEDLVIVQCGHMIRDMCSVMVNDKVTQFTDICEIIEPQIEPTMKSISCYLNHIFHVGVHRHAEKDFVLKGQMLWLTGCNMLLFMGSPNLHTLDDFKSMKSYFADIPLYDFTRDLVLLNQERLAENVIIDQLNETTHEMSALNATLDLEKQHTEELLYGSIPSAIAKQMSSGQKFKPMTYQDCTVLFSDYVSFPQISATCSPDEIVDLLNHMFRRFDACATKYDIYRVNTISDTYMALTGVPEQRENHVESMAQFALDLLSEASHMHSPTTRKPVSIRIGMHSGPVLCGIIGSKKPRFDIYGETVNTASLMAINSAPKRIHVSKASFVHLLPCGFVFLARGGLFDSDDYKGSYFLIGQGGFEIPQPRDGLQCNKKVCDPIAVKTIAYNRRKSIPVGLTSKKTLASLPDLESMSKRETDESDPMHSSLRL